MNRSPTPLEREPMSRWSRFSGERLFKRQTGCYHTELRRGRIILCGCAKWIKNAPPANPLTSRKGQHWCYRKWSRTIWRGRG